MNDGSMGSSHQNHQSEGRKGSFSPICHRGPSMVRGNPPQAPTPINQASSKKIQTLHNHKTSKPGDISADAPNHLADPSSVSCVTTIPLLRN